MSETLDLVNCIEIQEIREILINHPDLLSMFELLILVCNKRINDEKTVINLPIEENIEPVLSSDSEDDIMEE